MHKMPKNGLFKADLCFCLLLPLTSLLQDLTPEMKLLQTEKLGPKPPARGSHRDELCLAFVSGEKRPLKPAAR